jgi:hypothetical protein
LKLSSEEYSVLHRTKFIHWFCRDCKLMAFGKAKSRWKNKAMNCNRQMVY